jgi:hypothetical protein
MMCRRSPVAEAQVEAGALLQAERAEAVLLLQQVRAVALELRVLRQARAAEVGQLVLVEVEAMLQAKAAGVLRAKKARPAKAVNRLRVRPLQDRRRRVPVLVELAPVARVQVVPEQAEPEQVVPEQAEPEQVAPVLVEQVPVEPALVARVQAVLVQVAQAQVPVALVQVARAVAAWPARATKTTPAFRPVPGRTSRRAL